MSDSITVPAGPLAVGEHLLVDVELIPKDKGWSGARENITTLRRVPAPIARRFSNNAHGEGYLTFTATSKD